MANEAETSLLGFAEAFGIVAGVAVAVGAVAAAAARALKQPIIPRWRAPGAVWPGPIIILLFLGYTVAMQTGVVLLDNAGAFKRLCGEGFPSLNAPPAYTLGAAGGGLVDHVETDKRRAENQLRAMWTGYLIVPVMVAVTLLAGWRVLDPPPLVRHFSQPLPGRITFGVCIGLLLVPLTFAVNAVTMWVATEAGTGFDRHPLSILKPTGDGYGGLVFGVSVIGLVPVLEELLFRGLVVNWAAAEWHRPWAVMVFAVAFALQTTGFAPEFGPVAFLAFLAVGLYLIQRFAPVFRPTFPTRTTSAVWSSAALFAVAHSAVWPTPIPLFALGLGLGYLTARTRDITAAVVVHGMFNAVSFVYLLRGGTG